MLEFPKLYSQSIKENLKTKHPNVLLLFSDQHRMENLIKGIEERLFSAEDTVCLERANLVTAAYRAHSTEPMPIRRALAFGHTLKNMSLDLESNPVFAGNTSSAPRAWMLVPEFDLREDAQISFENPATRGILAGRIPDEILSFWDSRKFGGTPGGSAGVGHMGLDFDMIVNQGLNVIIRKIESLLDHGSEENRMYRKAMIIGCRAVIAWAGRYADMAEKLAMKSDDPVVSACQRRVAETCRRVPAEPARNLFEGLQSIALVHLASVIEGQGMSVSIGLPDRVLSKFSSEAEENTVESTCLIRAFLLKIAANSFQGRGSKTQAVTIGGSNGKHDACNAITRLFLDGFSKTPVNDPQLFLRWHPDLDEDCWKKGLEMLASGRAMPMLVNDMQVVPGLVEAGVSKDDAWNYCIVGCNELGIPGRCCQSGFSVCMGFNDLEVIDRVIRSTSFANPTASSILDEYEKTVSDITRDGLAMRLKWMDKLEETAPFPFCSACCQGPAESGQDLLKGMKYPNIYGLFVRGTSNAANVLAAIDDLVTRRKEYKLPELLESIGSRDPHTLAEIAKSPKWGNDDDSADQLCLELNRRRDRALRLLAKESGLPPFPVCHVVRSLHHLDGMRIGNTLDGREAGSPVADSIGSVLGTQTEGPTALLNSVAKIDASRFFAGIYNLNITLPSSPDNPGLLRCLTEAFFKKGGQEIQINVFDAARLREAQIHPELFRDLIVRISGFNARFIELSKAEQDELIRRAENANTTGKMPVLH